METKQAASQAVIGSEEALPAPSLPTLTRVQGGAGIRISSWRNSCGPWAIFALAKVWLNEMGLHDISSVEIGVLLCKH
jgi:hypothetical protein